MRRIIMIGTAVAVLVTAGAAIAALNNYTASFAFTPTKAGTAKNPVPVGFRQILTAQSTTPGSRAAALKNIKTWVYGLQSNAKYFPTCSLAKIAAAKDDASCPHGALVAEGPVNAQLGSGQTGGGPVTPCNPYLHVWNSGPGKLTFFFITSAKYVCAGLHTGASAPYAATVTQQGKWLVTNVPLPPDVSTNAGGIGLYAGLVRENLVWHDLLKVVKGKHVGFQSSVGCVGNKRPWKVAFTAQNFALASGPKVETITKTGSSPCSK